MERGNEARRSWHVAKRGRQHAPGGVSWAAPPARARGLADGVRPRAPSVGSAALAVGVARPAAGPPERRRSARAGRGRPPERRAVGVGGRHGRRRRGGARFAVFEWTPARGRRPPAEAVAAAGHCGCALRGAVGGGCRWRPTGVPVSPAERRPRSGLRGPAPPPTAVGVGPSRGEATGVCPVARVGAHVAAASRRRRPHGRGLLHGAGSCESFSCIARIRRSAPARKVGIYRTLRFWIPFPDR